MKKVLLGLSIGLFSLTSAYANYPVLPDVSMTKYGQAWTIFITPEEGFIPNTLYNIHCNISGSGKMKTQYTQSFSNGKLLQTCDNMNVDGNPVQDCTVNLTMGNTLFINNVSVNPPYQTSLHFEDDIQSEPFGSSNSTIMITCYSQSK